jgi:hypothetical protein
VHLCYSQRTLITGFIVDTQDHPIIGGHVRNLSIDKITVSSVDGRFQLPALPSDTLYVTTIGFAAHLHVLTITDFGGRFLIRMEESALALNEVTVLSIPPIEKFKEMIMETKVKDSAEFWYFGVEKPVFRGDKMAEGRIHKKFLYAVLQPTNFLYYNTSKQEKEKRKYYQLQQNETRQDNAEKKFTREWVAEHTGLEGDKLTSFIAFCNFSVDYLDHFPIYVIMEDMMVKFDEFKKLYGE